MATLRNQNQNPGSYQLNWDGKDARGLQLKEGAYFYRFSTGENQTSGVIILL